MFYTFSYCYYTNPITTTITSAYYYISTATITTITIATITIAAITTATTINTATTAITAVTITNTIKLLLLLLMLLLNYYYTYISPLNLTTSPQLSVLDFLIS